MKSVDISCEVICQIKNKEKAVYMHIFLDKLT